MILPGLAARVLLIMSAVTLAMGAPSLSAQSPPVLQYCFPAGGQAGHTIEITVGGDNLDNLTGLLCSLPDVTCTPLSGRQFQVTIPPDAPVGHCDLWAVSDAGISAPCPFIIGNREETRETEPNNSASHAQPLPLNSVVNGRIDQAHDVDWFQFTATEAQKVVIACDASRMDSSLRAVLEVLNADGKRLAINRGYFGTDPLIDFRVPADGTYAVRLNDLVGTGDESCVYRLSIDSGPRVAFALPNVVQRDRTSRVTLYGWNLNPTDAANTGLDTVAVDIAADRTVRSAYLAGPLLSTQTAIAGESFAWLFPGSAFPVVLGLTDVPVIQEDPDVDVAHDVRRLTIPCEVSGQLIDGDERDWFAFDARRGEVIYLEAAGQQIQSPVDLHISVFGASGTVKLADFHDEVRNIGGAFRTDHLDPSGRWVCPEDGRYLILVHNVIGGLQSDPRRVYRLSVRREEPEARVFAVPHQHPSGGLNVRTGGRLPLDLIAIRRRGLNGSIRVSARDLPTGIEFPDVWFGPGVDRTIGVLSSDRSIPGDVWDLTLDAHAEDVKWQQTVAGGTVSRSETPNAPGRFIENMRVAVAHDAAVRLTADAHQPVDHHLYGTLKPRHSPGGIVDVAIRIDRQDAASDAPVKLIGIGLPDSIGNQSITLAPGQSTGYLSYYMPPTLSPGHYSFAIQAETTVPNDDGNDESVTVFSNPVTIHVVPSAFLVTVDPFTVTEAKRGQIIQIPYIARRLNGFIGKMHTELASAGVITDVPGLRGRGVTSVGQSESGVIQIEVNSDAPLGEQRALRLLTVGVEEDEVVFHGSHFLTMEITD